MRSEQDGCGERRFEGQYEKDPWRSDRRRDSRREQEYRSRQPGGPEDEDHERYGEPHASPHRHGYDRAAGYERRPEGAGSLELDWRAERRYPPGPKGYLRSDERLREDISARLMEARHVDSSDVTVEVLGAKVVLDGTVPARPMKHAIEDLVDDCPGVQDIDSRIRVRR